MGLQVLNQGGLKFQLHWISSSKVRRRLAGIGHSNARLRHIAIQAYWCKREVVSFIFTDGQRDALGVIE